jgi:hypothetical protein
VIPGRAGRKSRAAVFQLLGLGLVIALTLAIWRLSTVRQHAQLPSRVPDDDLPVLAGRIDAGPELAPARDVLLAGTDELYLSRASDRAIVAVPKSGSPRRVLAHLDGPVWAMALAGGALWLSTSPAAPDGAQRGAVMRLSLPHGAPEVIASGFAAPRAVASDGRWVFVVDVDFSAPGLLAESTLEQVPAGGGQPKVVARCRGEVAAVALDEARVYWADRFDGTIMAAAKTGGGPQVLASERGLPGEIVVDENALYWVEERSESLWTMPKAGGSPRQIAQDFAGLVSLAADARSVWWVNATRVDGAFHVVAVPKTGGDPRGVTLGVDAIGALASDGTGTYWERDGGVWPLPR